MSELFHKRFRLFFVVFICFLLFQCKKYNNNTNDSKLLIEEYQNNIDLAIAETNPILSLPYALKAKEIALKLNDKKRIANSCIELSHDYEKTGNLTLALSLVLEAAVHYEKIKNMESVALCFNRIGTIYFKQGDTVLSNKYLLDALAIHKQMGIAAYIGGDLVNIGEIYRIQNKPIKAKFYFTEALSYFVRNRDSIEYAYTIGNLGLTYTAMGFTDSANYYLKEAGSILRSVEDYYPITVFIAENAKILADEGLYEQAIDQVKKSISLSEQEGLLQQISDGYKLLSEIQKQNNNYEEAYDAFMVYHTLRDSLTNANVIRKMESQRTDFEISKRESVIENLEHINKLRTIISIALGAGFMLILLFVFILYRIAKKLKSINTKLNANKLELEQKNKEIEQTLLEKDALMKEIHHRVKNNLQIISSLLSLQSRRLKDITAKAAIADSHQRLFAISLIHQNLYKTENIAYINICEYIPELMSAIKMAFSEKSKTIEQVFDIEEMHFDVDTAVPIGLIINELAINSYKYAFPGKKAGKIFIGMKYMQQHQYQLTFEDNGVGLPDNFDPDALSSLGIGLVYALSAQLCGELSVNNNNGASFILNFMDKKYRYTE